MAQRNMQSENEDVDFEIESKEKSRIPPEVLEAFGSYGLPSEFKATLYKMANGNKSPAIESSWEDYCPTIDEIGNQFGAGTYSIVIEYNGQDNQPAKKKIRFTLGESYNDKYIRAQQIKRAVQAGNTLNNGNELGNMLDNLAKLQAVTGKPQSNDLTPIIALVTGFMGMMQQQNQQMISLITQKPVETDSFEKDLRKFQMFKEVFNINGAGEKELTMGEKLVDAGIEMFKVAAPELIKKLNNPILAPFAVSQLEKRAEFQEMKNNPEQKKAAIEYLRATFPAKQVETALAKTGLNGP